MRRPPIDRALEIGATSGAVAAAVGLLLGRLVRDVHRKPLFVDEVVSGLTAARPLVELLQTVVVDRGGAPGHFVLVHLVFAFQASADSLRWTSVACAAATVVVSYDLGRRLQGKVAGVVTAFVVATSPLLGVYGTFGRMYALFALAAAVAADLLVRALHEPSTGRVAVAALAVALLPLVHPYGLAPAVVVAAATLLHARRLRLAAVVALAALAAAPTVVAGLRLSDRFGIGRRGAAQLLSPSEGADYVAQTIGDFAGGDGLDVALAVVLALAGIVALRTAGRAFVVVGSAAVLLPFLLLVLVPTGRPQGLAHLSSRHMIFALPVWAALVGVGTGALLSRGPRWATAAGTVAVAVVLTVGSTSGGSGDPRLASGLVRVTGSRSALDEPARWLRERVQPGDLLFYASPVFLEALPQARHARLLDPAPGGVMGRTLERARFPVPGVVVAVPFGQSKLDFGVLAARVPRRSDVEIASGWLVIRVAGPHTTERGALEALNDAFDAGEAAVVAPAQRLRAYFQANGESLCGALRARGGSC